MLTAIRSNCFFFVFTFHILQLNYLNLPLKCEHLYSFGFESVQASGCKVLKKNYNLQGKMGQNFQKCSVKSSKS